MQTKRYNLDEITAILNLTPEAFLRDYSRIHVIDPQSDNPQFVPVLKSEGGISVDLPPGSVDIMSVGFAGKPGTLRLSVMGDLPTILATKLMSALNWRNLDVDATGHSSYGFFPLDRGEYTHFLMGQNSSEAIRLSAINGKPVTKLEFASLPSGTLELMALVDGQVYRSTIKATELKSGLSFSWNQVNVSGDIEVLDISTRIVDEKVGTFLATKDGVYLSRENEVTSYKATKGKIVRSITAGFAGCLHDPKVVEGRDTVGQMAFITRDGDKVELFIAPLSPSGKVTSVDIKDETIRTALKADHPHLMQGDDANWYVGLAGQMSIIPSVSVNA